MNSFCASELIFPMPRCRGAALPRTRINSTFFTFDFHRIPPYKAKSKKEISLLCSCFVRHFNI